MSTMFRRFLATHSSLPSASSSSSPIASSSKQLSPLERSKALTLPLKIRERRARFPNSPSITGVQKSINPSTGQVSETPVRHPSSEEHFQKAFLTREEYVGLTEEEAREKWSTRKDAWRSRVRGFTQVLNKPQGVEFRDVDKSKLSKFGGKSLKSGGERLVEFEEEGIDGEETLGAGSLAAERIYLPNIQIRLVRNYTPPGQPYDPYHATFRIPPSLTKTDLRSYLKSVYNLPITFIRTSNYIGEIKRIGQTNSHHQERRETGGKRNYKKAIVGLKEPFHYPDDKEELEAIIAQGSDLLNKFETVELAKEELGEGTAEMERFEIAWAAKQGELERTKFLEANYMTESIRHQGEKLTKARGWKGYQDNKGKTIRAIMARRTEREAALARAVAEEVRLVGLNKVLVKEGEVPVQAEV